MEESRSRVHHGANTQVRQDSLLHPRSRRLYYRGRAEHRAHVRLTPGPDGMGFKCLTDDGRVVKKELWFDVPTYDCKDCQRSGANRTPSVIMVASLWGAFRKAAN